MAAEIQALDHVQLPIPLGGARQARAFYEQALGLVEWRDPRLDQPGVLRYRLGSQRLDLCEGAYTGVAPQAHLALQVHALDALHARLQAAGWPVDRQALDAQVRLYVEDPFGNRLELIERLALPRVPLHVDPQRLAI
ncbi:VOC family protein [Aquariibacter albus]|uniref:VOC family protein n=1 Tax=Aquariibacter albus TaxID=2759899 RepID=A0A839HTY5_9BURK|nr:VOC family protein [Aquariibacter albus]MBB1162851.1 VOC family protein [Aquariibacter albus]